MSMAFPAPQAADRYDAALSAFVPINEPEHVRKLRKRLMAARDHATRSLCNADAHTPDALSLFHVIINVASAHVFRFQDLGSLPAGAVIPFRAQYIRTTGTSAADILALY